MKKEKTIEKTIEEYVVPKVITRSGLKLLFQELNINTDKFDEWMSGQTMMGIGNETCYFYDDVVRFVKGSNVID